MKAYRAPGGGISFSSKDGFLELKLELPCGQCVGCRIDKAGDWAKRCMHESKMHAASSFVTLTYRDEDLPRDRSVEVRAWQLFAKRLRKRCGAFRFFACGEYGGKTLRPHYHALIFGLDFLWDARWLRQGAMPLWTSMTLEEIWGLGMVSVGAVTPGTAGYVSRYCVKKLNGDLKAESLRRVAPDGAVSSVAPEFLTMSRRPGIGAGWFERFFSDVFPRDEVIFNGRSGRVPRFYRERLSVRDPVMDKCVRKVRRARAMRSKEALTWERLRARDVILSQKVSADSGSL